MKIKRVICPIISLAVLLSAFSIRSNADQYQHETVNYDSIGYSVNNGEPIRGVDISSVISLEKSGVVFRNENGEPQDIFKTLAENGVNYIRVRVWNNPYDKDGKSYGGGNCDKYVAAEIGKRAAKYNMKLLVDLQYSDFWADPEKQTVPRDWAGFPLEWKKTSIYNYTADTLQFIKNGGANIGMVQIGNETNGFFCGEKDMNNICSMFSSGCKAVRDFDKSVLIAVHFANPSTGYYDYYAEALNKCWVDYDVFATSYYPYWHGSTDNLTQVLKRIADKYNKYIMVAETAYPYTDDDGDNFGNAVSKASKNAEMRYDVSVQGQEKCISDVFKAVAAVGEKGIGAFYWEPAWIGIKGKSYNESYEIWNKYGSGWATDYAASYDSSAKSAGGSSYDNQALFDFDGKPLESLKVFKYIYPEKKIELPTEPKSDSAIKFDINGDSQVDIFDAVVLKKALKSGKYQDKYDLNKDGKVNSGDLSAMKKYILASADNANDFSEVKRTNPKK